MTVRQEGTRAKMAAGAAVSVSVPVELNALPIPATLKAAGMKEIMMSQASSGAVMTRHQAMRMKIQSVRVPGGMMETKDLRSVMGHLRKDATMTGRKEAKPLKRQRDRARAKAMMDS
jgi:hypothetical protein